MTTTTHKTTTQWRVPYAAWLPISLAIAAETVSNALRAYGLGTHLDRFTITIHDTSVSIAGAVLVLAAVAVSLSQARAAWVALTPGNMRQRIVSGIAAALLLTISVTAMASHILEAQRAKVTDEGGARGRYDRAKAAYDAAAAELAGLGDVRAMQVIQGAIVAVKIDMGVWNRSKKCEDISRDDSRKLCEPILALYQQRGKAARKAELSPQVEQLRRELAALDRPEQAGIDEDVMSRAWAWIMGIGVVFIATFGTVIFARVTVVAPSTANDNRPLASAPVAPRVPPSNGGTRQPAQRVMTSEHPVIAALRSADRPLSNDELAAAMGVSKGEASKRRREVDQHLTVHPDGRCLRIALAG
jgi:hypothetical protein